MHNYWRLSKRLQHAWVFLLGAPMGGRGVASVYLLVWCPILLSGIHTGFSLGRIKWCCVCTDWDYHVRAFLKFCEGGRFHMLGSGYPPSPPPPSFCMKPWIP